MHILNSKKGTYFVADTPVSYTHLDMVPKIIFKAGIFPNAANPFTNRKLPNRPNGTESLSLIHI